MIKDLREIYLGEGKPPPKNGYKKIYQCPQGLYPKLIDVALKYNMFKSNVHRRFANPRESFKDWKIIYNPTEEQMLLAIDNANTLYIEKYEKEVNCPTCDFIDDLFFQEGCWVVKVIHEHHTGEPTPEGCDVIYSFRGQDYKVNYNDWVSGFRPHSERKLGED